MHYANGRVKEGSWSNDQFIGWSHTVLFITNAPFSCIHYISFWNKKIDWSMKRKTIE
jgi:hypothetical protein